MVNTDRRVESKNVNDLEWVARRDLCKILNQGDKWEDLADQMKYDASIIRDLRTEDNPTDQLLEIWSYEDHTILELFILLSNVHHYQAMMRLKQYVDDKYHRLIYDGEANLKRLHRLLMENSSPEDLRIAPQNFNELQPASVDISKVAAPRNNAETKLNISPEPSIVSVETNSDNMLSPSSLLSPNILSALQPVADVTKINNKLDFSLADGALPQIPYNELTRATDNWSACNILGKGSFGTVFKGKLKGMNFAIKRIEHRGSDAVESYLIRLQQSSRELKILNSYKHDNILSVCAYGVGPELPCLVYQFMVNGSLEDRLLTRRGSRPLTWLQRHEIAKGTARGIQFLHTFREKPLIHGDIRSANIFLDKNLEPRIRDFGFLRRGSGKDGAKVSGCHETNPYLPIEILHGKTLSTKIDTYSFGIMLFELATGLPAVLDAERETEYLKDFIDNCESKDLHFWKDKNAETENDHVYENLIDLGKWCSKISSKDRPEIELVLRKIDKL